MKRVQHLNNKHIDSFSEINAVLRCKLFLRLSYASWSNLHSMLTPMLQTHAHLPRNVTTHGGTRDHNLHLSANFFFCQLLRNKHLLQLEEEVQLEETLTKEVGKYEHFDFYIMTLPLQFASEQIHQETFSDRPMCSMLTIGQDSAQRLLTTINSPLQCGFYIFRPYTFSSNTAVLLPTH